MNKEHSDKISRALQEYYKSHKHWAKDKLQSNSQREKISIARKEWFKNHPEAREARALAKTGERNPLWKGDKVGYHSLHTYIKHRLLKPERCPICGKKKELELSSIKHTYTRNLKDWEWLCTRCHIIKDGRMDKLISRNKKGRVKNSNGKKCELWKKEKELKYLRDE